MMTWITYDKQTGTILSKSATEPAQPSIDKDIAEVDFNFFPGQRTVMLRYDGANIVPNLEANINLFAPLIMAEISAMKNTNFSSIILNPSLNQTVYVKELDITMEFDGVKWKQCGEETIFRSGLISGSLYVNNMEVG